MKAHVAIVGQRLSFPVIFVEDADRVDIDKEASRQVKPGELHDHQFSA